MRRKLIACVMAAVMCVSTLYTGFFDYSGGSGTNIIEAYGAEKFYDIEGHWAKESIVKASELGMVNGDGKGRYIPNGTITRAEFVTIINNLLKTERQASISQFTDANPGKWYYKQLQMAYQIGIISGKSNSSIAPNDAITRQEAASILARMLELNSQSTSVLAKFKDAADVAAYAEKALAAMVTLKYINGIPVPGGKAGELNLSPKKGLTRAETAAIMVNIVEEVFISGKDYSGYTLKSNMVVNTPGAELDGAIIGGDLIIGDGVADFSAFIENCQIAGRLIVRAGGEYSVNIENSTIAGGIIVNSPSYGVRLEADSSSKPGGVRAKTSTILSGDSFLSLTIPSDAQAGSRYTVDVPFLDSIDINAPSVNVTVSGSSEVNNVRFNENSANSKMTLERYGYVRFLGIHANNIRVDGTGKVGIAQINSKSFSSSLSISDTGSSDVNTSNQIDERDFEIEIFDTDPAEFTAKTTYSTTQNTARIRQTNAEKLKTSYSTTATYMQAREAFWLGLAIENPSSKGSSTVYVTHKFDGEYMEYPYKDSSTELLIYVPVTRNGNTLKGSIDEKIYIDWGGTSSYRYEVLNIKIDNVVLAKPDEEVFLDWFRSGTFIGVDGTEYFGSEAIKRLLLTENSLGLDLKGYKSFPESEKNALAVTLNAKKDTFTNKASIQQSLVGETNRKGALYVINNALTGDEIRNVIDDLQYAQELGIDASPSSKYGKLSDNGKSNVANLILTARKVDFANAEAFRVAYNKALDTVVKTEVALLQAINTAATPADEQKIIENKANATALGVVTDGPPYTNLDAAGKLAIGQAVFDAKPFATLQEVSDLLMELIGEIPPLPPTPPTPTSSAINSIKLSGIPSQLAKGEDLFITATLITPEGKVSGNAINTTWEMDETKLTDKEFNSDGARVIETDEIGTAKITVTSVQDPKKKATATIKIVKAVLATEITLSPTIINVNEGEKKPLTANMLPDKTTDLIKWESKDPSIATVSDKGSVLGVKTGFTEVEAITSSGKSATATVKVYSKTPGVLLSPKNVLVGVDMTSRIDAIISPYSTKPPSLIWTSSDSAIVKVSDGIVEGKAIGGPITVTAKIRGNETLQDTSQVTVDDSKGVKLDKYNITMGLNGEDTITATLPSGIAQVFWETQDDDGNPSKAVIDIKPKTTNSAVITAKSAGKARVKVAPDYLNAQPEYCYITVESKTYTITIGKYEIQNVSGAAAATVIPTFKSTPQTTPQNKNVTWNLINGDSASVEYNKYGDTCIITPTGKSTALKDFTLTFTATPDANTNGKITFTVTVKIVPIIPVKGITWTYEQKKDGTTNNILQYILEISKGANSFVTAYIDPPNATNQKLRWTMTKNDFINASDGSDLELNSGEKFNIEGTKTTITTSSSIIWEDVQIPLRASDGAIIFTSSGAMIMVPEKVSREAISINYNRKPISVTALGDPSKSLTLWIAVLDSVLDQVKNINVILPNWVYKSNFEKAFRVDVIANVGEPTSTELDAAVSKDLTINSNPIGNIIRAGTESRDINTLLPGATTMTIGLRYDAKIPPDSKYIFVAEPIVSQNPKIGIQNEGSTTLRLPTIGQVNYLPIEMGDTSKKYPYVFEADENIIDFMQRPTTVYTDDEYIIEEVDEEGNKIADGGIRVNGANFNPLKPGIYKIFGRVTQKAAYMQSGKINTLKDVINYELSGITSNAGIYYGPNYEDNVNKKLQVLDPDRSYNLVVKNTVTSGDIYVWVKPGIVGNFTLDASGVGVQKPIAGTANVSVGGVVNLAPSGINANASITTAAGVKWELIDNGNIGAILTKNPLTTNTYGYVNLASIGANITANAPGTVQVKLTLETDKSKKGLKPLATSGDTQDEVIELAIEKIITITFNPESVISMSIVPSAFELMTGGSINLAANILPAYKDLSKVTWSSSDTTIATVNSASGRVTASNTKPGTATIIATFLETSPAQKIITASAICTVSNGGISGMSAGMSQQSMMIPSGQQITQSQTTSSGIAEDKTPQVTTSPAVTTPTTPAVTTTPSATTNQPTSTGPKIVTMTGRTTATIGKNNSTTLLPVVTPSDADRSDIKWTSSNPKIATVDNNGAVSGVSAGRAVIKAVATNGKTVNTTVTVLNSIPNPLTSITLSKQTLATGVGNMTALTVKYTPTNATVKGVSWTTSNDKVATVDQYGRVKGIALGSAVITAISDDGGRSATCDVTISVPITSIKVNSTVTNMTVGQSEILQYTILPSNAGNGSVNFRSTIPAVVSVDSSGNMTALKKGTAYVYVSSSDGKKTSYTRVVVR